MSASRPLVLALGLGLGAVFAPQHGLAQVVERVGLSLTVSHASPRPGPMDPLVAEVHRRILKEFRYGSLHVIQVQHLNLGMQEVGGLDLPTGKRVELRPLALTPSGVLIAVEIPGTLQTDLRVPNQRQVVIGVDHYGDGKLLLTLQPDY